jgi:hypothetical protein
MRVLSLLALVVALAVPPAVSAGVVYRQQTVCRNGRCQVVSVPVQQVPACTNCPTAAPAPQVIRLAPGQTLRQTVTYRVSPAR